MEDLTYQLFFSYARTDNAEGEGWVTAFYERLRAQHRFYTGRELQVFFDKEDIKDMQDWRRRILVGLRQARLFVAFLSPNFLASPYCRLEWEEYLRREHSVARGDDGIAPVYFVNVPELHGTRPAASAQVDQALAAMIDDLRRRNQTRGGDFDLREWFAQGPQALRALDAAERLAELRAHPQDDATKLLPLAERIAALDRHIVRRLDRCLLAELAPGNLQRSYAHFVGRHEELRRLHTHLVGGTPGLITALHGLGGQGKTALAVQYAFAYAEFYAAGGRWLLPCEGKNSLAEVLETLALEPALGLAGGERKITAAEVLHALERFTRANAATIRGQLANHPDRESPADTAPPALIPRCLLVFDNVDDPDLFSADEVATYLKRAEWLEFIVTTRLDAEHFGVARAGQGDLVSLEVDSLPLADALELLREFQPGKSFADEQDDNDARALAKELGGYTLAVELAGAYLGAKTWRKPGKLLAQLQQQGLTFGDTLAKETSVAGAVRHREKQVGFVLETTLNTLHPVSLCLLEYAACLPPDRMEASFLPAAAAPEHAELADPDSEPWMDYWDQLRGLRLLGAVFGGLPGASDDPAARSRSTLPQQVRIHRLVAAHVLNRMSAESRERRFTRMEEIVHATAEWWTGAWRHQPEIRWMRPLLGESALHLLGKSAGAIRMAAAALSVGESEMKVGLLSTAETLIRRGHAFFQAAQASDTADENILGLLAASEAILGSFYMERDAPGDLDLATDCFVRNLETHRRLVASANDSAQAEQQLAEAEIQLGQLYLHRDASGDAVRAMDCFERARQLLRELLDHQPDSVHLARIVSISAESKGDCYLKLGGIDNLMRALDCYESSWKLRKQIMNNMPGSTDAARGVIVAGNRLAKYYLHLENPANFQETQGQFQGALGIAESYFAGSLKLARSLAKHDADSNEIAHDVCSAEYELGGIYLQRGRSGDIERALRYYERALKAFQALYGRNPGSTQAARDLLFGLGMCCQVSHRLGRGRKRDKYMRACFSMFDRFLERGLTPDARMRALWPSLRRLHASSTGEPEVVDPQMRARWPHLAAFVDAQVQTDHQTTDAERQALWPHVLPPTAF